LGGGGECRSTDGGRSMWTSTKAREDAVICTYPVQDQENSCDSSGSTSLSIIPNKTHTWVTYTERQHPDQL